MRDTVAASATAAGDLWITSAGVSTHGQTAGMKSRPLEMTIRTDADVRSLWTSLVPSGKRRRRSLWVALLDANDRTLRVAFPIDDLPAEPDALLCGNLAKILADLTSTGPAHSAVLLLCRPGPESVTMQDRRWAARLRGELGAGLCRWPVHLATPFGIHSLETDDLSAAS
jgi:hypothetical protein